MPLRINLNFCIDSTSIKTRVAVINLVQLADLSGFLKGQQLEILRKLADGTGVKHDQIKECSTEEFRAKVIRAAEDAGLPRGDLDEVRETMRSLGKLFQDEMLVDQWATLMFRKYAHHGGMDMEKKS